MDTGILEMELEKLSLLLDTGVLVLNNTIHDLCVGLERKRVLKGPFPFFNK